MGYQSIHTGNDIDTGITNIQQIFDLIYPIGSYYMSSDSANPSTKFGGTWEQITDRMIMAAGSTYAAGETGGVTSHTHTTAEHALTINEMPSHGHGVGYYASSGNYVPQNSIKFKGFRYQSNIYTPYINGVLTDMGPTGYTYDNFIETTGGGTSHNHGNTGSSSNLPPYIVAYIWRRTA